MVIELEIEFHENEIPPKCRLPRPVEHKDTTKVKIAETTPEEAPTVFVIHGPDKDIEVRRYKNRLYKKSNPSFYNGTRQEEYPFEDIPWQTIFRKYNSFGEYTTRAEYEAYLKLRSKEYLIVDKVVFIRCFEPYYHIATFGYSGCGTAIFPEFCDNSRKNVLGYSALDKEIAIKDAIQIARSRKDEGCIERIENLVHGYIEVVDPTACKRKFTRQI